jgi:hypothetical protein
VEYTARYDPKVSPVTGLAMGQNAFFRVTTGGAWDYVPATTSGTADASKGPFLLADFATLFRPDQS